MCLNIAGHPKQMTAKEDIKCYKVLAAYPTYENGKINEDVEVMYYSPYQNTQYYLGETIREKGRAKREYDYGYLRPFPTIGEGCLHTFINLEHAIDFANHRYPVYTIHREWVVVECIIPKGTKYYEGVTNPPHSMPSYASKVLRITDKVVYETPR